MAKQRHSAEAIVNNRRLAEVQFGPHTGHAHLTDGREIVNIWTERAGVIDPITLVPKGSAWWLVSALTFESKGMPVGRGEPSGFRFECEAP